MGELSFRNKYYTEDEFEEIQKNHLGKAEYSDGEILLSSTTSRKHNRIVSKILSRLEMYLDNSNCEPYSEQIEIIFADDSTTHKFKPDIFVACDNMEHKGESFIVPPVPPLIIFEIVSPDYSDHDYFVKARIYQKFGVLEYNIVEQDGIITQYKLIDGRYLAPKIFNLSDTFVSTIYSDFKFNMTEVFK